MNPHDAVLPGPLLLGAAADPAEHEAHTAAGRIAAGGTAHVVPATRPVRAGVAVDSALRHRIDQERSQGHPLPRADRAVLERGFGTGLGNVRLHTGAAAHALCRAVCADAFTVGRHVFVDGGYRPGTEDGRRLLAHEVAHVLQGQDGVIRRRVVLGNNVEVDEPGLRKRVYAQDGGNLAQAAIAAGVDVDTLIQSYVLSPTSYWVHDVYAEITRQTLAGSFQDDMGLNIPGVAMKAGLVDSVGTSQQFAYTVDGTRLDFHPQQVMFRGTMQVRFGQDANGVDQTGLWTLGVVQNVLQAHRAVTFVKSDRSLRTATMTLGAPANDRRDDGVTPWYDRLMSSHPLGVPFESADVVLDDKPGFWVEKHDGEQLHDVSGTDEFRTWLVLRRDADGWLSGLYSWDWKIEYSDTGGTLSLTGEGWYPDVSGVIQGGSRAGALVGLNITTTEPENHESSCPCTIL